MQRWIAIVGVLLSGACAGSTDDLTWVAPIEASVVPRGDAIELAVTSASPDARAVHFLVDGAEVGVCDPAQADEDCRRDDVWRWTVVFDRPGAHEVAATLVTEGGGELVVTRLIEATEGVPAGADLGEQDLEGADRTDPDAPIAVEATGRGSLDPVRGWHNIFGGISWTVSGERVHLASGTPAGDVTAVRACMNRYGTSIRRWADHFQLSRASILATAIAESNCTDPAGSSDGLSSGPMQVTASTCAALTGLSRSTCRLRMHTSPDFSFQVGATYISSSYQRAQHHRDPPKIAAAYNAGSLQRSYANHWHLVSTGNHIDRWVRAYNAYRTWEGP